ncbi:hypothetical protein SKAU_G00169100 [Synaphobranchus kaupii]|uniref:Sushi domain-containing protein n=1 Tax=Synaphobranchus kaupii TaxID=118154 RepID=A0A9Q1FK19_SYNKA|nr:hypothetical protein SKAU_G00169100 [Synaphobranchus kaupii]
MPRFWDSCSHLVSTLFLWLLLVDCGKAQCQLPVLGLGLELTDDSAGKDTFPEESSVTLQCSRGFSKASGSGDIFCFNGEWEPPKLQCKKKSCGSPGELLNGKFNTPDGNEFGATAYASCNRGFIILGTAYRQCFEFGWNNKIPICEIVKCQDPPTIVNGKLSIPPKKEFPEFRDIIAYTCNKNYNLVGGSQIVCNEHGTYNGTIPQCKDVSCPTPVIENAVRTEGGPPPYKLQYFVVYECLNDYVMNGSSKLVCEIGGWSSDFPTCVVAVVTTTPTTTTTARITTTSKPGKNETILLQSTPSPDQPNDHKGIIIGTLAGIGGAGVGISLIYIIIKRIKSNG